MSHIKRIVLIPLLALLLMIGGSIGAAIAPIAVSEASATSPLSCESSSTWGVEACFQIVGPSNSNYFDYLNVAVKYNNRLGQIEVISAVFEQDGPERAMPNRILPTQDNVTGGFIASIGVHAYIPMRNFTDGYVWTNETAYFKFIDIYGTALVMTRTLQVGYHFP